MFILRNLVIYNIFYILFYLLFRGLSLVFKLLLFFIFNSLCTYSLIFKLRFNHINIGLYIDTLLILYIFLKLKILFLLLKLTFLHLKLTIQFLHILYHFLVLHFLTLSTLFFLPILFLY